MAVITARNIAAVQRTGNTPCSDHLERRGDPRGDSTNGDHHAHCAESHKYFPHHQHSATFKLEKEHGKPFACMVEFDQKASVTDVHAPGLPRACWGIWGTFWSFNT